MKSSASDVNWKLPRRPEPRHRPERRHRPRLRKVPARARSEMSLIEVRGATVRTETAAERAVATDHAAVTVTGGNEGESSRNVWCAATPVTGNGDDDQQCV